MTVIVDTSVLIDHLRGTIDAQQALRAAADSGQRVAASVGSLDDEPRALPDVPTTHIALLTMR